MHGSPAAYKKNKKSWRRKDQIAMHLVKVTFLLWNFSSRDVCVLSHTIKCISFLAVKNLQLPHSVACPVWTFQCHCHLCSAFS